MTMTMTRPAAPPLTGAERAPARGSAQRAAVITLILAVIFQPVLHPTGPGNSSPVDLLLIASIVTATVWLAGTHRKLRAPYVIPVALFIAAGAASGLVSPLPTTALTDAGDRHPAVRVVHNRGQRAVRAAGHALRAGGLELVRHLLGRAVRGRLGRAHHAARRDQPSRGQPAGVHLRRPELRLVVLGRHDLRPLRLAHAGQAVDAVRSATPSCCGRWC